jgi:beta-fructofuranosidase
MLYHPPAPAQLWDTWIFVENQQAHLFYLRVSDTTKTREWDSIGHVISDDLVHWQECESIVLRTDPPAWDSGPSLTGSTLKHDGRYWMFYGSLTDKLNKIGLLVSDDLMHWEKYSDDPVLLPMPPYQHQADIGPMSLVDWRDPACYWHEELNCWEVLLCARQQNPDPQTTGACIAKLLTKDFKQYQALDPITVPKGFFNAEVPDYFQLGDWHYLLFSSFADGGGPCRFDTPTRYRPIGTWYMRSDHRDGPYELADDPFLVGSCNKRLEAYVGRTMMWEGKRLLYHHMGMPDPAWALPKIIEQNQQGDLHLGYWSGLKQLHQETRHIDAIPANICRDYVSTGDWHLDTDGWIVGQSHAITSSILFAEMYDDFELTCTVDASCARNAAVLFHMDRDPIVGKAVSIQPKQRVIENNDVVWTIAHSLGLNLHDDCLLGEGIVDKPFELRMVVRGKYLDCYINDRWYLSNIFDEQPVKGRIGLSVQQGVARFRDLQIHILPKLMS